MIAELKCYLFRTCAEINLCKRVVCAVLRAKYKELPPVLVETFVALLVCFIGVMIYLIYHLYESCPGGRAAREEVDSSSASEEIHSDAAKEEVLAGGAQGDALAVVPVEPLAVVPVPPVSAPPTRAVRMHRCPPPRRFLGFARSDSKKASKKDSQLCRKRLSNLLHVSPKCLSQKRLQAFFRADPVQLPRVTFQVSHLNLVSNAPDTATANQTAAGIASTAFWVPRASVSRLAAVPTSSCQSTPAGRQAAPVSEETPSTSPVRRKSPCFACTGRKRTIIPAPCHQEKSIIIRVIDYLSS